MIINISVPKKVEIIKGFPLNWYKSFKAAPVQAQPSAKCFCCCLPFRQKCSFTTVSFIPNELLHLLKSIVVFCSPLRSLTIPFSLLCSPFQSFAVLCSFLESIAGFLDDCILLLFLTVFFCHLHVYLNLHSLFGLFLQSCFFKMHPKVHSKYYPSG